MSATETQNLISFPSISDLQSLRKMLWPRGPSQTVLVEEAAQDVACSQMPPRPIASVSPQMGALIQFPERREGKLYVRRAQRRMNKLDEVEFTPSKMALRSTCSLCSKP